MYADSETNFWSIDLFGVHKFTYWERDTELDKYWVFIRIQLLFIKYIPASYTRGTLFAMLW